MSDNGYQYLEPRPGGNYKQWYIKGRRIRAEVLYRETIGEDARTPEEVAHDFSLPLEAVREAIDYCLKHPDVIKEDSDSEWETLVKGGYVQASKAAAAEAAWRAEGA
jgi:uncharacterized protein (DUF433 family)